MNIFRSHPLPHLLFLGALTAVVVVGWARMRAQQNRIRQARERMQKAWLVLQHSDRLRFEIEMCQARVNPGEVLDSFDEAFSWVGKRLRQAREDFNRFDPKTTRQLASTHERLQGYLAARQPAQEYSSEIIDNLSLLERQTTRIGETARRALPDRKSVV